MFIYIYIYIYIRDIHFDCRHHDLVTAMYRVSGLGQEWPRIYSVCWSHDPFLSSFLTNHLRRGYQPIRGNWVHPRFCGIIVAQSLVVFISVLSKNNLLFCTSYFGHCVVWSSIYGFWFLLWFFTYFVPVFKYCYSDSRNRNESGRFGALKSD